MPGKANNVPFVHLHCHTDHSLYDGFQTIEEMVDRAKELNFGSIAITDHGKVSGFIKFFKECKKKNIKPIFGVETYLVDSLQQKKGKRYHLVLLAKNRIGYENILKISTISHKNSYRGFPRGTLDILKNHKEGLIVLSGCIVGQVPSMIREDNLLGAEELAKQYKDIFGQDYYFEIMWTHFKPEVKVIKRLLEMGKKLEIPVVATNDCHYARKENSKHRIIKMEIYRNRPIPLDDYPSSELYIKSYEEMKKTLKGVPEECLSNTVKIADKCNVEIDLGKAQLPTFVVPTDNEKFNQFKKSQWGKTDEEMFLVYLAEEGLKEKGFWNNKEYQERLNKELETIRFTGFVGYFLVVWDYIKWARSKNIRIGAGRGCFCGDNVVISNGGNRIPIKDIEVGDNVMSCDGKYHAVEEKYKYFVDEEIIEILTDNGKIISCTKDHRILANRNGLKKWIKAECLVVEDDIVDVEEKNKRSMSKINSIETKRYRGLVYDLSVPDKKSYNIDGLCVHNSAAGSLVIYCLNITNIDPIKYELSMDRFLYTEAKYRAKELDFFESVK